MVNQRNCPFCKAPAAQGCHHLVLACPGRDFVQRCVEFCHGHRQWSALCRQARELRRSYGDWSPDRDDFTWLETAFCERFLKHLRWFGGLDHEWRSGPSLDQGGFWVLLWSKEPRRLAWELLDEFERQVVQFRCPPPVKPIATVDLLSSRQARRP